MNESVKNRAAAIRHYLRSNVRPPIDPALIYKYAAVASRWEAVRLQIDRGNATPADDARFTELSAILGALTVKVGLPTCKEEDMRADGIPGLTDSIGMLPRDPQRILGRDWREAAEDW